MTERKTCNTCKKRRWHIRGNNTIYSCQEPKKSTSLIHPTIITLNKAACEYYEEKGKEEYVGSALAGYNKG